MMIGLVSREQIETLCTLAERLATRGREDESRTLCEILAQNQRPHPELPTAAAVELPAVTP